MNKLNQKVEGENWATFLTILLGTWFILALYIQIHDQVIIRIEPRHFTEYHSNPYQIQNPYLLAAGWGIAASVAPGLLLGLAAYIMCRLGTGPKLCATHWFKILIKIILVSAALCWMGGLVAHKTGFTPFNSAWYPEETGLLFFTQTVQIYAYLGGALLTASTLLHISISRRRKPQSLS